MSKKLRGSEKLGLVCEEKRDLSPEEIAMVSGGSGAFFINRDMFPIGLLEKWRPQITIPMQENQLTQLNQLQAG